MKYFLIVFLMFLPALFFGQNVSSEKTLKKVTIKTSFNLKNIKAYQENSVIKIEDYYSYLELYSNKSTSDSLKLEIKNAIKNIYNNTGYKVLDITSKTKNIISLEELFQKIEDKNYTFQLGYFENSIVGSDYWTTKYSLEVKQNENFNSFEVLQQVNFKPILKTFGKKQKEVWTLWLGQIL